MCNVQKVEKKPATNFISTSVNLGVWVDLIKICMHVSGAATQSSESVAREIF